MRVDIYSKIFRTITCYKYGLVKVCTGNRAVAEKQNNFFKLYNASGHLLEDIQNYHVLYGLVKVCTGNRAVAEKRNNFFKEWRNVDGHKILTTGAAIDAKVNGEITARNIDLAFGGAIFKENESGADGTIYDFQQDV